MDVAFLGTALGTNMICRLWLLRGRNEKTMSTVKRYNRSIHHFNGVCVLVCVCCVSYIETLHLIESERIWGKRKFKFSSHPDVCTALFSRQWMGFGLGGWWGCLEVEVVWGGAGGGGDEQ